MPDLVAIMRRMSALLFSKNLVPAWILLGILLCLTYGESYSVWREDRTQTAHFLKMHGEEINRALDRRFKLHEALLQTASGFIVGSENVTEEEWDVFSKGMSIFEMYPEMMVFGYAEFGDNFFQINHLTVAPDMVSKFTLDDLMKTISEERFISLALRSRKVEMVPDNGLEGASPIAPDEMPNFLLLAEEFKGENGLIFAWFSMREAFYSVLKVDGVRGVRLQMISEEKGLPQIRYDSHPAESIREKNVFIDLPFARGRMVDGGEWILRVMPTEDFDAAFRSRMPVMIAVIGTFLSFLVFTILLLLSYISQQTQQRLTDSLYDREKRLEIFLKRVPVAIAMFDKEMRILAHSDRWAETTGLNENMIGRNYFDVIQDERVHSPKGREHVARALAGEAIEVEKTEYIRPNGEKIYVHYRIHPWHDLEGNVQGAILFVEDVTTAFKATEKLKRTNQELEQFAYIASHDLKAPLRGIDNLAKWIEEDIGEQLPGDSREKLVLLRGRVHRLELLLEGILKYSRIGRIVEKAQDVDTTQMVRQIGETLIEDKNYKLRIIGDLPKLNTLRTPLEQIFANLITNAIKHHNRPSGVINIKAEDKGNFYEFSVKDDGPGIPPEFHERVFGMFQTLQSRDKKEGSGMGMAIVKKLVEWQGGKVWIAANENTGGTAIHFLWPKISKEGGIQDAA